MSPAEVLWRAHDKALQVSWSRKQVNRGEVRTTQRTASGVRRFSSTLPVGAAGLVPSQAAKRVIAAADQLLLGEWEVLGVERNDMVKPDWFHDPVTGRQAPANTYAFRINHRSETQTGNVKQIWEISRLQHLTLLAAAWFVSHNDAYARRAADQLESWWRENPFLSGVNWTSGIEIGLRLISMVWIRRLLDDWPGVTGLFEDNGLALTQISWHQQYLAAFRSRGSSANNHVIAEAAGQLVASCAFAWFPRSADWQRTSARLLERELRRNTFPSGLNRELASDYHGFVAELGLLAALEADAAGSPLSAPLWQRLCAMFDSGAAVLDEQMRPPRQGDGDEGRALLIEPPAGGTWTWLLGAGQSAVGRLDWWPRVVPDATSSIIGAFVTRAREIPSRPAARPWRFADAGLTVLRTAHDREPEIWCRCDAGPHGYLSIAAHAHADALSVEVRCGGTDILADPGTFCYHGEPPWRSYFRSTIAHNTVELDCRNQSAEGGPFLWLRHANSRELEVQDIGDAAEWTGEHDGYLSLDPPGRHRRCVRLDRASRIIDIVDEVDGGDHDVRMAFHLGPEITAELQGSSAALRWPRACTHGEARLELPVQLQWSVHRGETDPIIGWYSTGLGRRVPSVTLIGSGHSAPGEPFSTRLEFLDVGAATDPLATPSAVSLSAFEARAKQHAEAG